VYLAVVLRYSGSRLVSLVVLFLILCIYLILRLFDVALDTLPVNYADFHADGK